MLFYDNDPTSSFSFDEYRHHIAVTYDGTTIRLFVDGDLKIAREHEVILGGDFVIGASPIGNFGSTGRFDHFRIWRTAIWTENFTPPTAADYL